MANNKKNKSSVWVGLANVLAKTGQWGLFATGATLLLGANSSRVATLHNRESQEFSAIKEAAVRANKNSHASAECEQIARYAEKLMNERLNSATGLDGIANSFPNDNDRNTVSEIEEIKATQKIQVLASQTPSAGTLKNIADIAAGMEKQTSRAGQLAQASANIEDKFAGRLGMTSVGLLAGAMTSLGIGFFRGRSKNAKSPGKE